MGNLEQGLLAICAVGAGAAENASVAENFSTLRRGAPNFGAMGKNAVAAAGYEERAVQDANTAALNARVTNEAKVHSAELIADARKDAASAPASAGIMGWHCESRHWSARCCIDERRDYKEYD